MGVSRAASLHRPSSTLSLWAAPGNAQGEHQEVYDHLCFFYWLIDQPVFPEEGVLQHYDWFEDFLVAYADLWGSILETRAICPLRLDGRLEHPSERL